MAATAPGRTVFDRAHRALSIGLLFLVSATAFERLGVTTALPAVATELDGISLYGWAFSAFLLANVVGLAVAGAVFDRFGIAKPLCGGVLLFTVGLLLSAIAPSMSLVVVGRAVQGLGAGFLSVATYSSIGWGYSEEARPKMLALNAAAFAVPSMIGPLAAGLLVTAASWRWVFAILVPLVPIAAMIMRPQLLQIDRHIATESPKQVNVARPTVGGLVLMAGIVSLLLSIDLTRLPRTAAIAFGCTAIGVALRALLPSGTLRARRGLPANVAFGAALSFAFFVGDIFLPLGLATTRGVSATAAGLVLTTGVIAWTAGSWLASRVSHSLRAATVSAALVSVGLAGITAVLLSDIAVEFAYASWAIAGVGAGVAFTVNSLSVLRSSKNQIGLAAAQMDIGNYLGTAAGTALGGELITATSSVTLGAAAILGAAAAAGLVATAIGQRLC